jgi:hypothetical protein
MKHMLTFPADVLESADRYQMIYDGLTNTPRGFNAPAEGRVFVAILEKFEAIGTPKTLPNGTATYVFNGIGGNVELNDAEYALAKSALDEVKWLAPSVRRAIAVLDWFSGVA